MSLLPKEHGAYGQVSLPLITAFAVAGMSAAGALVAAAAVAGFLAHEPAAVVLGLRGPRVQRQLRPAATKWLIVCLLGGAVAGGGAMLATAPTVRWSIAVPAVPALLLSLTMMRNREKSWYGEAAAALAFSGTAVPATMAAGASIETALAVAIPFALLFLTTTLAVRVVILRVRGGGDPRAAAATRFATIALTVGSAGLLGFVSREGLLSSSILLAAAPGLLTAGTIALHPSLTTKLRWVGWTLVAVSVVTAALVVLVAPA
jgi:hypothetical protein